MDTPVFDLENCPIARVSKIIQGKWTMVIIHVLSDETLRFSEIHRRLPHLKDANLTKDLRTLEAHGVVHRKVYPVVPPRVEYSLTEMGKAFLPILDEINSWAEQYAPVEQVPGRK